MNIKKYSFKEVTNCVMCGSLTRNHAILGQRLNQSQGFIPKSKIGISVSIQRCSDCGLIYSNPLPIPFDLQDHYGIIPEEYWEMEYHNWKESYFDSQLADAKDLLHFQNGMKALDIGAGIGKAMKCIEKAGFDVYGIEPSIPFYERAINNMKIDKNKLQLVTIDDFEFESDFFDFITFGAVFEHLYDPLKSLEKALSLLKPNGIIHLEVPSSNWLISRMTNFYYKMIGTNFVSNLSPMHSPFHLYEFDINSFKKCSNNLNFTIEKYYHNVCEIYNIPKFFHPILKMYMDKTYTGMQITIYLRKTDKGKV